MKTTLLIRPAARGGKYLGADAANSRHESALVIISNAQNQKPVAVGIAQAPDKASAGPSNLMDPVSRCDPFAADSQTVQVQLSVDIDEPTTFTVTVLGPLSFLDQASVTQTDIIVLPGVNIGLDPKLPEGLVIEIPGLCISGVTAVLKGPQLSAFAKVTMMCGCPIKYGKTNPGWFWPDTDFTIQLVTFTQSGATYFYTLSFDNNPALTSSFTGAWPNKAPNDPVVSAWIYASEPKLGNQGKYRIHPLSRTLAIQPKVRKVLAAAGYDPKKK